jgi:uncharacterized protein YqeY
MKGREKERLSTLRLLLAALKNERISQGRPVDEAGFLSVVKRAIKQRREAAGKYREGGRPELAAKEEREEEILAAYLPAAVSEEELRQAVDELVAAEGLQGPKALGRIMKTILARYAGRADGATLQRIARQALDL